MKIREVFSVNENDNDTHLYTLMSTSDALFYLSRSNAEMQLSLSAHAGINASSYKTTPIA